MESASLVSSFPVSPNKLLASSFPTSTFHNQFITFPVSDFSKFKASSARTGAAMTSCMKVLEGDAGYVLQDVPHLTDYLPDLPTNPAYSVVKQYFVNDDDTVAEKIVVHKGSDRGVHFRRAGPRQRVFFESDEVHACIVTCGGLCPGLNTVCITCMV